MRHGSWRPHLLSGHLSYVMNLLLIHSQKFISNHQSGQRVSTVLHTAGNYKFMFRCFVVSLFHCFVVSLSRCFIVSLFHFANYHKPWTGVHQRVIWLGMKIPIPGNIYMYMYSTVHCRLSTKIVRYVVYILQFFTLKFCPDSESHSGKVQFYQAEQYYLKVVSPHTIILVCI